MTYAEAIKILHPDTTFMALAEVEYFGGFNGEEAKIKAVEEACVIACEALAKQIPKKPYWEYGGCHCKSCGLDVLSDEHFCPLCGQAIDWEVSE